MDLPICMFHCVSFVLVHHTTSLFMYLAMICHIAQLVFMISPCVSMCFVVSFSPTCSMVFREQPPPSFLLFGHQLQSASTVVACSKRRQSGQRREAGPHWRHSAKQCLQNLGSIGRIPSHNEICFLPSGYLT